MGLRRDFAPLLHLIRKPRSLSLVAKPIGRDALLEPQELRRAPDRPGTGIRIAMGKFDETIPCVGYDGDMVHRKAEVARVANADCLS
jgi:hypothetical protein